MAIRVSVWFAVVFLGLVGVTAAVFRAVYVDDLAARAEPVRAALLVALDRPDPLAAARPGEVARLDRRFAAHHVLTWLHVLTGGLFMVLAPLQFSRRIRTHLPRVHRWSGRILLVAGAGFSASGLFFGLAMPFGGSAEAVPIALFGGLFVVAAGSGWAAIRNGEIGRHREWMTRAFAAAFAVSTVRVVGLITDVLMAPTGVPPRLLFVADIWIGWSLSLGAAEWWIRRTRVPAPASAPELRPAGVP